MNVPEYISSGIIESYVLGLAEPAEREEFERMCAGYPEVREAREAFEISLEQYALLNQVQPSANLKSRIFAAIDMEKDRDGASTPPSVESPVYTLPSRDSGRVVGMGGWQRYLAAASVILLLISTAFNFYFFNKYKSFNIRYNELVANQAQMASNNKVMQTRLLDYERSLSYIKDPNMAIVKMPANPKGPDPGSQTTVYWNNVSKDVYLVVNQLPVPGPDQQYQLWALVDGKPVDAGVFDLTEGLVKMKNIPRAQAFAITLEKKGGSAAPTMEKLYVLGKV